MIIGGNNFEKMNRSRLKKYKDEEKETFKEIRKKHRDKTLDRMRRREKYEDKEYLQNDRIVGTKNFTETR
jgi:hypothetical protein